MNTKLSTLLFAVIALGMTPNVYASESESCGLSLEEKQMSCRGTFKASSIEDLERYKNDFALRRGKAKSLYVNFDLEGAGDLDIKSPCKIVFASKSKMNWNGNVCINGHRAVIVRDNASIETNDLYLTSKNRIAIRKYSKLNVDNLSLISTGDDRYSRVHIRHHANVVAKSITMKAHLRSTLGHSSLYEVEGNVSLESSQDFSSIWRNSKIMANEISFVSENKVRLTKGNQFHANKINVKATECKIHDSVELEANSFSGNCVEHLIEVPVVEGPQAYFKYEHYYSTVTVMFFPELNDGQIVSAQYSLEDGRVFDVTDFNKGSKMDIELFQTGEYDLTLTTVDDQGKESQYVKRLVLMETEFALTSIAPVINFTANQNDVLSIAVDMNNTYHPLKYSISTYSVDFGDGNVVSYPNIMGLDNIFPVLTNQYGAPGTYEITVSVDVTNGRGLSDKKMFVEVFE